MHDASLTLIAAACGPIHTELIEFRVRRLDRFLEASPIKATSMLAEKFFLVLESLIRGDRTHADGSPRIISTSPHVPLRLPARK